MFAKKIKVPVRSFYCELKHRPPGDDGSNEKLIEVLELQVPRLKNSDMEKQWVFALAWGKLDEPEYQHKGINQIFIFTAQFGELLMRIENQPFEDEPARSLNPPEEDDYKQWQAKVEKRFRELYGISIEQWQKQEEGDV